MHLRIYLLVLGTVLLGYTHAEDGGTLLNPKDDIYIDDEVLEGSGGGNQEIKDDLEASGSGRGDDDEDSEGSGSTGPVIPGVPPKETIRTIIEPTITQTKAPPPVDNEPPSETNVVSPKNNGEIDQGSSPSNSNPADNEVIMNRKGEDRTTSFFAQPGILAAVIGGAVVGLLCAILVVMFIVYRMRKKDEGSYALDEPKRSPTANSYTKNSNREFYA